MKWLAMIAMLIALGLLTWGVHLYRIETRPEAPVAALPLVEVEWPERDLGAVPVGTSELVFRVTNSTDRQAEVLSAPTGCGKQCCIMAAVPGRKSIPPGGSINVVCELTVVAEGAFEIGGPLYLYDNGVRSVELTVRGTGVAGGANKALNSQ